MYTSEALLDAEARLRKRAATTTGPTIESATIRETAGQRLRGGARLGADQTAALQAIVGSGRLVDVLVGPAGAGKSTVMGALRRAWEAEYGRGSVIGLAPSAAAAQVLAEDLGIATENLAKWWQNHLVHGDAFRAGQLVIVDEASLAGTLALDRVSALAAQAGAKVLLVGDYAQLQSVDAGGAFAMLVHDHPDAPELVDVHRFIHDWEKTASLGLRRGDVASIDRYYLIDHEFPGKRGGFIHVPFSPQQVVDQRSQPSMGIGDMAIALEAGLEAVVAYSGRPDERSVGGAVH